MDHSMNHNCTTIIPESLLNEMIDGLYDREDEYVHSESSEFRTFWPYNQDVDPSSIFIIEQYSYKEEKKWKLMFDVSFRISDVDVAIYLLSRITRKFRRISNLTKMIVDINSDYVVIRVSKHIAKMLYNQGDCSYYISCCNSNLLE